MKFLSLARMTLLSLVLSAPALLAQSNSEVNSGIQFNFSSPGARSLSLGGAFLGLADDATAAYTNPAGLTNLTRPEVSVEGRRFQYTSRFLSAGSARGTAGGIGIDDVDHPIFADGKASVNRVSYASAVYPIGRFAFAFYYHDVVDFQTSVHTDGAFFFDTQNEGRRRFLPITGSVDVRVSSLGGSVAYRVADEFAVGVSVSSFSYKQNTLVTRYKLTNDCPGADTDPRVLRFQCHADYSSGNAMGAETAIGDDSAVAVNAGILWKPSRRFSAGVVYRQGPSFTAALGNVQFNVNGSTPLLPPGTTGKFHVPDVFGVGFAVGVTDTVTVTADYDRVRYSQLSDGIVDVRYTGDPNVSITQYTIKDGNEGHLGIQWAIPLGSATLALRGGGWYDPAHALRFNEDYHGENLIFRGGKIVYHYTGGLGLAVGEHFQIDAAGDFASTVKTGSVSTVFRF